MHTVDYA